MKNINWKVVFSIVILTSFLSGLLGAAAGIKWYRIKHGGTVGDSVKSYYNDEMASVISPADVRALIDKKDHNYVLVDLRTVAEYDAEHIVTAVNIPAGSLNETQLLVEFNKLPQDKKIIVYCYSASCTLGRQVGQFLANKGFYVRDMDVGWSEWKYYWGLWNPGDDPKAGNNYVTKGIGGTVPAGVCVQGKFGC